MFFNILSSIFDQIFDQIDVVNTRIIDLKQWNILTQKSCEKIKKEIDVEVSEMPLQGFEVFKIIEKYKENKKSKDEVSIYKDIKIGLIMYLWFLATVIYIYLK